MKKKKTVKIVPKSVEIKKMEIMSDTYYVKRDLLKSLALSLLAISIIVVIYLFDRKILLFKF